MPTYAAFAGCSDKLTVEEALHHSGLLRSPDTGCHALDSALSQARLVSWMRDMGWDLGLDSLFDLVALQNAASPDPGLNSALEKAFALAERRETYKRLYVKDDYESEIPRDEATLRRHVREPLAFIDESGYVYSGMKKLTLGRMKMTCVCYNNLDCPVRVKTRPTGNGEEMEVECRHGDAHNHPPLSCRQERGTIPCGWISCATCEHIDAEVDFTVQGRTFHAEGGLFTCQSCFVVYCFVCGCGLVYVGSTTRSLARRQNSNRFYGRTDREGANDNRHINAHMRQCDKAHLFTVRILEKVHPKLGEKELRKAEGKWIRRLGSLWPGGLNATLECNVHEKRRT